MPSLLQIKKRISSVSNIAKITKAMEMVSASKMRQAQVQALASRHYSRKLDEILSKIAAVIDPSSHPLLSSHSKLHEEALVIISTDRGLTGSLNSHLFKTVANYQQHNQAKVYTVGRLAKEYAIKSGFDLVAEFGNVGEKITYELIQPVAGLLMKEFLDGNFAKVSVVYMDFISTLNQTPRIVQLLPLSKEEVSTPESQGNVVHKDYLFEPNAQDLLGSLLPYMVEMTLYQCMLEARASEHSARMVAMKNASDNAKQLKGSYTLQYNRSRQANITNELADMVTATMSLSK